MTQTPNNLANYIWSLADLLRGDFKQSQYGRIILPFTLLRRLECVLAPNKAAVLAEYEEVKHLVETFKIKSLQKVQGEIPFYNTSPLDLFKLSEKDIKNDLEAYVKGFSPSAREIFEYFKFNEFVEQLSDANLLYKVVKRVRQTDLSLAAVSPHDMGLVFEELIRKFAESSNETAGEHFTPRDIVRLTTALVLGGDKDLLSLPHTVRTIYDPTAGTGGFLSAGMEYVYELNPLAKLKTFGQELNPESYAICKGDMLIKGQDVSNIKLGNTLTEDQLAHKNFDYMLSNPPFGVDWKKIEEQVKKEHSEQGYNGRFGPGLPRVSDGSLLFLLHLIHKLPPAEQGGGRIGIILNGSPLFTGGAGSGESEIRRYILEADLLEAIIALPTDMFYNTGIATYIWILTNKKKPERQGQVQLIDGSALYGKMRKSLGSKRNEMDETHIEAVIAAHAAYAPFSRPVTAAAETRSNRGRPAASSKNEAPPTFACKIFPSHAFGYRRITVERPLRESYAFSDERIEALRYAPGALTAPMRYLHEALGGTDPDDAFCDQLRARERQLRSQLKRHHGTLKEKQLKALFDPATWRAQKAILDKARQLQVRLGTEQRDDRNDLEPKLKASGVELDAKEKKQIIAAVTWKNPDAARVIHKVHKGVKANPLYGLFDVDGRVISYQPDSDLRDHENIPLDPTRRVGELVADYVTREVLPHVPEAWIDGDKRDPADDQVGIVGYEIPFNRHFYQYQPPRDLAEIDADLDAVSADIMRLLQEVHS